jgi:hypothetical protein
MTETVAVAAEATTEATKQENDEDDNQDESQGHSATSSGLDQKRTEQKDHQLLGQHGAGAHGVGTQPRARNKHYIGLVSGRTAFD